MEVKQQANMWNPHRTRLQKVRRFKNRLIKFEISLRMVIKELEELEKDYTTERSE